MGASTTSPGEISRPEEDASYYRNLLAQAINGFKRYDGCNNPLLIDQSHPPSVVEALTTIGAYSDQPFRPTAALAVMTMHGHLVHRISVDLLQTSLKSLRDASKADNTNQDYQLVELDGRCIVNAPRAGFAIEKWRDVRTRLERLKSCLRIDQAIFGKALVQGTAKFIDDKREEVLTYLASDLQVQPNGEG